MNPRHLISIILLGVLLYLTIFAFVVDKPLTVGEIGTYIDYKTNYLASIAAQRKIAIFAGSNGRYGHRCQTITELTGIPCANISSAAGFDLGWQMSHYLRYLRKGDVLYMPLEYWPLIPAGAKVGSEAPYVVRHDHCALASYAPGQLSAALFYFDVRYLFSALGEMLLNRAGIQRRTSTHSMTPEGDERGATAAKAVAYRDFINTVPAPSVSVSAYDDTGASAAVATVILAARTKGVIVVGGLPTTFVDTPVSASVIERLRTLYAQHDACFLELPGRSLYPRSSFFDTEYHLQESAQIAHSRLLAQPLARIWHSGSCTTQRN
jgi:hypothetical protein